MTRPIDVERIVDEWLVRQAPPAAPDRVLGDALARIAVVGQGHGLRELPAARMEVPRWLRIGFAAAVVAVLTIGMLALSGRPPLVPRPPWEAVFLRLEPRPGDGLIVVASGRPGQERVLARLPTGGLEVADPGPRMGPPGVISPEGILAIARLDEMGWTWHFVDLSGDTPTDLPDPELQLLPGGRPRWGPLDADGRRPFATAWDSGAIAIARAAGGSVARIGAVAPGSFAWLGAVAPGSFAWLADGSGLLVQRHGMRPGTAELLRLDGTVADASELAPLEVATDGLGDRHWHSDGRQLVFWQAPPGFRTVGLDGTWENVAGFPRDIVASSVQWTADGSGVWVARCDPCTGSVGSRIERFDPGGGLVLVARLAQRWAQIAGIAPDDSLILTSASRSTGTWWLIQPATGRTAEIDGIFVGWLKG